MISQIHITLILALASLTSTLAAKDRFTLRSPDQNVTLGLKLVEGIPHYSVSYGKQAILADSRLGLQLDLIPKMGTQRSLGFTETSSDTSWEPVWNKASSIRDHYNEVRWNLESADGNTRWNIVARAYDNGVAVRYDYGGSGLHTFDSDLTEFRFAGDYTCWSANGENANIGPVPLSKYPGSQLPLTVKVADDCYTAVLEANIANYAQISLKRLGATVFQANMAKSTVTLPAPSSWRVLLLGKTPGRSTRQPHHGQLESTLRDRGHVVDQTRHRDVGLARLGS